MRRHLRTLLPLLLLVCCSCNKTPDTLVTGGYDEKEMEAAIAKAKGSVDSFITELKNKNGSDFSVKAPIEDNGETEHFWLTDITYNNGQFEGIIGNEPGLVSNVTIGQKWTIAKADISDWMFMREGKIHGNYTMRPLLATLPADEAEQMRSMLAEP